MRGWIGVDLDGTLAFFDGWKGPEHIGAPIEPMMERVRLWISSGVQVRIFTARACIADQIPPIRAWLDSHGLEAVGITNAKDFEMIELWDDRAIGVRLNTGERIGT